MKKYKILRKCGDNYFSPFQDFKYGKLEDFIRKEMVCEDFDEGRGECSRGFYATDIEGLIYTNLSRGNVVFEMDMGGKMIQFNQFKQRFEKQTFVRELHIEEVKGLVKYTSDRLGYNLYEALFPYNPLCGEPSEVTEEVIELLGEWIIVRDSVWGSVRDSVWGSVWDSVRGSVRGSVRDSVWDSVWGSVWGSVRGSVWDSVWGSVWGSVRDSVSSLFPRVNFGENGNPYMCVVKLWKMGFVPSFDGEKWRLHSGKNATVVYEK